MIRAGNYALEDKGFSVTTARMGGVFRQALIAELPGGITEEELEALCAGPIEVLDEQGEVAHVHEGPFIIASHQLKLVRESESHDVATLNTRVATLEAELAQTKSAKESALEDLASLSVKFDTLMKSVDTSKLGDSVLGTLGISKSDTLSDATVKTDAKGSV